MSTKVPTAPTSYPREAVKRLSHAPTRVPPPFFRGRRSHPSCAEGPGGTLLFERMTENPSHPFSNLQLPPHHDGEFREGPGPSACDGWLRRPIAPGPSARWGALAAD